MQSITKEGDMNTLLNNFPEIAKFIALPMTVKVVLVGGVILYLGLIALTYLMDKYERLQ